MTQLDAVMAKVRAENRAALIAYIPAGFPSKSGCAKAIQALADAGVDAIEIGFPYSDPVMDGPVIQEAADIFIEGWHQRSRCFRRSQSCIQHWGSSGCNDILESHRKVWG